MGVDTKHIEYKENQATWKLLRDSIAGAKQMRNGGEIYVPKLSGQNDTDYLAMTKRPPYENYVQRTLDGLTGLVFSKEPVLKAPKLLEDLKDNIDAKGKSLTDIAQEIVSEVESVGRVGILIDSPSVDVSGMTQAESESLNNRPFIRVYDTESIINWKYETINNKEVLSMVVLAEMKDDWIDMFDNDPVTFYRVLHLLDGVYTQSIYEEVKGTNTVSYKLTQEIYQPKMNGKVLYEIPFIGITPDTLSVTPAKSPLYDLADVNLAHFKINVDYYTAMHLTATPTGYGTGFQLPEGESMALGGSSFTILDNPDAKLSFLEYKGDGLGTLEREKKELKEAMVILGSNMLQGDKNVAESENTVAMRSSGERATLISVANTCSRGITKALELMALWLSTNEEVSYALNTDYNLSALSPQAMHSIVEAWQLGGLTKKNMFTQFKKGEIIEEDETYEDWSNSLELESPILSIPPTRETL